MQVADFGLAARISNDGCSADLGAYRVSFLSKQTPVHMVLLMYC